VLLFFVHTTGLGAEGFFRGVFRALERHLALVPVGEAPQQVTMQLIVKPTDSAHVYTWQIRYGEADNRPYLMKAVDTAKGHWQLDEQNGIRIDQYWLGNRLTSAFSVLGATIVYSYWREGETLVAESYYIKTKEPAISGSGTEESPKVESFKTSSFQRAVLKRLE
jgi:hypothetical protein